VHLTSALLILQSDSGVPVCARASRLKADTLNTNLATSFRPLLVGHIFVLVKDFNVYQRLLLIFVAVSVIELIFVQQCFYRPTVYAASHLKGVVVNLASLGVS